MEFSHVFTLIKKLLCDRMSVFLPLPHSSGYFTHGTHAHKLVQRFFQRENQQIMNVSEEMDE